MQSIRLEQMQHELHMVQPSDVYTVCLDLLDDGKPVSSTALSILSPGPPDVPLLRLAQTELDTEHGGHSFIATLTWEHPAEYPPRFIVGYQLMAGGYKVSGWFRFDNRSFIRV